MSETVTGGLALALGSAAALNWGFFRQHVAASSLPRLSVSRPVFSLGLLFRNPSWLSGFVAGLVGWALYVAALRLAPLSLVQAVSAGGIGVLALLVTRTGTVRLARRERLGVAAALGGLAALGLSLAGGSTHGGRGSWLGVTLWAALSVAWAGLAAGPLSGRLAGGAGFGVAAGSLYAAGDVATKAAVWGGAATLFVLLVLACHGLAFACLQLGFQRGSALATAGLSTLFTNALPIVAGMALFGERLPGGALGVLRGLSFVAVVVGAAALARSERHDSAEEPARVGTGPARLRPG